MLQDNKLGIVGVVPDAELYAVKVLDQNGRGKYSDIIAALEWAIDNNMDIINMSLGGMEYRQSFHEAVQHVTEARIIIVAAAGNAGEGNDNILYPAKFPEVIAVGAIDDSFRLAGFSITTDFHGKLIAGWIGVGYNPQRCHIRGFPFSQ